MASGSGSGLAEARTGPLPPSVTRSMICTVSLWGVGYKTIPRSVGSPKPEPLPKSEASMTVPVSREMPLTEAIATYMAEVRQFRSPKTIAACEHILTLFGSRYPRKTDSEPSPVQEMLGHMVRATEPWVRAANHTQSSLRGSLLSYGQIKSRGY